MLVDTDVLIDYLRGQAGAQRFLEDHIDALHVSVVTVGELYQGVREGRERTQLNTALSAVTVLPLTEEIAQMAGLLYRDHRATLGCGLADCMIAATAAHHQLKLATLNAGCFAMLDDVLVPYVKD